MNWFEKIKKWYREGYWTAEMVENAVTKNKISQTQAIEILGGI